MSQETRGDDSARLVKLGGFAMMAVGIVLCFVWPRLGVGLLIAGFFTFVAGRFMD